MVCLADVGRVDAKEHSQVETKPKKFFETRK